MFLQPFIAGVNSKTVSFSDDGRHMVSISLHIKSSTINKTSPFCNISKADGAYPLSIQYNNVVLQESLWVSR